MRITNRRGILLRLAAVMVMLMTYVPRGSAQMQPGQVDIFIGADLQYRDVMFNGRVFDVMLSLTPGVKWNFGHRWEASARVWIPVINQFGDAYTNRVRLDMLTVSKQLGVGTRWRFKGTAGLFDRFRYGIDVKAMFITTSWLAFTGEIGVTGFMDMSRGFDATAPNLFSFLLGPEFWIDKVQTSLWARGGRFAFGDFGVIAEGMRHFKHVSVGLYAAYSNDYGKSGGFKVIIDLPPYRRTRHRVNFRPIASFRLTNNIKATSTATKEYITDPEQTERSGWFDPDLNPWGREVKVPQFIYKTEEEIEANKTVKRLKKELKKLHKEYKEAQKGNFAMSDDKKEELKAHINDVETRLDEATRQRDEIKNRKKPGVETSFSTKNASESNKHASEML